MMALSVLPGCLQLGDSFLGGLRKTALQHGAGGHGVLAAALAADVRANAADIHAGFLTRRVCAGQAASASSSTAIASEQSDYFSERSAYFLRNPDHFGAGVLHLDLARHQADQRAEDQHQTPIQIQETSGKT